MGDDLGSIYVSIRADTSQLKGDLDKARAQVATGMPAKQGILSPGGFSPAVRAANLAKHLPIRADIEGLRGDLDQAEQMIGTSATKMTRAGYFRMSAKLDKLEDDLRQAEIFAANTTEHSKHVMRIRGDVDAFRKDMDAMTVQLGKRLWQWNKMIWLFKRLIVAGGIGWVLKSIISGVFSAMSIAAKAMSNMAGGSTTLATNLTRLQTRILGVKAAFGLAVADALGLLDAGSKLGDSANTWGAAWGEIGNKLAGTFRVIKGLIVGIFVALRGLGAMMVSLPRMAIAASLTEPLQKMGAWLLKFSSDRTKAGKGGALTLWARDLGDSLSGLGNSLQNVSGSLAEVKADFIGGARDIRDAWNETGEEIGGALTKIERGPPPLTRNAETLGRAYGITTKTGMIPSTGLPGIRTAIPTVGVTPGASAPFTGAGSLGFGKPTGDDATTVVGLLNRIATATERSGGYYK